MNKILALVLGLGLLFQTLALAENDWLVKEKESQKDGMRWILYKDGTIKKEGTIEIGDAVFVPHEGKGQVSEQERQDAAALVREAKRIGFTDPEKRMALLQKAIQLDWWNSTAHYLLANSYGYFGDWRKGMEEDEIALHLDPKNYGACMYYGLNLYYHWERRGLPEGMKHKGIAFVRKALKIRPEGYLWEAHIGMARYYKERGEIDEAKWHLDHTYNYWKAKDRQPEMLAIEKARKKLGL